jgi:hypothetical protein
VLSLNLAKDIYAPWEASEKLADRGGTALVVNEMPHHLAERDVGRSNNGVLCRSAEMLLRNHATVPGIKLDVVIRLVEWRSCRAEPDHLSLPRHSVVLAGRRMRHLMQQGAYHPFVVLVCGDFDDPSLSVARSVLAEP